MKKDMDLLRNILLTIESVEKPLNDEELYLALKNSYTDDSQFPSHQTIVGHLEIMEDKGLVSVRFVRSLDDSPPTFLRLRLTWDGHKSVEKVRDLDPQQDKHHENLKAAIQMNESLVKESFSEKLK